MIVVVDKMTTVQILNTKEDEKKVAQKATKKRRAKTQVTPPTDFVLKKSLRSIIVVHKTKKKEASIKSMTRTQLLEHIQDMVKRHHSIMMRLSEAVTIFVLQKYQSCGENWSDSNFNDLDLTYNFLSRFIPLCQSYTGRKTKSTENEKWDQDIAEFKTSWRRVNELENFLVSGAHLSVSLAESVKSFATAIMNNVMLHFHTRHLRYLKAILNIDTSRKSTMSKSDKKTFAKNINLLQDFILGYDKEKKESLKEDDAKHELKAEKKKNKKRKKKAESNNNQEDQKKQHEFDQIFIDHLRGTKCPELKRVYQSATKITSQAKGYF